MSDDEQKTTAPQLAAEGPNQDLPLTLGRWRDETHSTFMGDAEEARKHMRALGTGNADFFYGLLHRVANVGSKGTLPDDLGIKFVLGLLKSLKPRDEIETMLLSQIGGFQLATRTALSRLAYAETLQERDSAEHASNKLGRTFAALIETLQRYRSASEQTVYVGQHVSVNEGGQAIVANVARRGRRAAPTGRRRAPPALPDTRETSMDLRDERQRAANEAKKINAQQSSAEYRANAFQSAMRRQMPVGSPVQISGGAG
jgi:hypothetical protein